MDISDILTLDCTACAVQGSSKKRVLEHISTLAQHKCPELSVDDILYSLLHREKMGSTGIGEGIAIPHGRIADIEQVIGIFITCTPAIGYDAIDDRPVDIFFALLVPEGQSEGHLQTLATIAAKLSDKDRIKLIRQAQNAEELFAAIR